VKWVGAAVLGIGALMLMIADGLFEAERQFLARASHTTGTVIQLVEHRSRKGSRSWAPRVTFRDSSGAQREFEGSVGDYPARNRVGDAVPVVYDSTKADIDSTVSRWLACWVVSGMGLVFLALGYGLRRT